MKNHWLKFSFFCLITILFFCFILVSPINAACPVCLLALPAAAGLALWLGIDRLLIGLYTGGLIILLSKWLIYWLKKKNYYFKYAWLIISFLIYFFVIATLYFSKLISLSPNQICGFDKLLMGIFIGSILLAIIFQILALINSQIKKQAIKASQGFFLIIIFLIILTLIYPVFFKILCSINTYFKI
ncbi:MAG: hypothetical protein WC460_04425 [Patescibacteria group bacterium]